MDPEVEQKMGIEEVQLGDLNDGDQIAVCGDVNGLNPCLRFVTAHTDGKYLHHGIFVKENLTVIELQGETKATAKPEVRPFLEFFRGHDKLYRVRYKDGDCLPVEETMRRAKEAVEIGNAWPAYSLIANNCESFATLLKTGRAVSKQVLMALLNILKGAAPGLAASIVASPTIAGGSLAIAGSVVSSSGGAGFAGSVTSGCIFSKEASCEAGLAGTVTRGCIFSEEASYKED